MNCAHLKKKSIRIVKYVMWTMKKRFTETETICRSEGGRATPVNGPWWSRSWKMGPSCAVRNRPMTYSATSQASSAEWRRRTGSREAWSGLSGPKWTTATCAWVGEPTMMAPSTGSCRTPGGRIGACKGSCSRNEAMTWEVWRVLQCVQILLCSRGMQVGICTLSTLININIMVKMTREEMEWNLNK